MANDERKDQDLLRQIKGLLVQNNSRMAEVVRLLYEINPNAFGSPVEGESQVVIEQLKSRKPKDLDAEKPKTLYCSFCGKNQHEVKQLIAGPKVFICNECVGLCANIVDKAADKSEK